MDRAKAELSASQSAHRLLCDRVEEAEVRRNRIEDALHDRREQLQALQRQVADMEAECRRDEWDLKLKDAAAAGGSVQVPALLPCCPCVQLQSP